MGNYGYNIYDVDRIERNEEVLAQGGKKRKDLELFFWNGPFRSIYFYRPLHISFILEMITSMEVEPGQHKFNIT